MSTFCIMGLLIFALVAGGVIALPLRGGQVKWILGIVGGVILLVILTTFFFMPVTRVVSGLGSGVSIPMRRGVLGPIIFIAPLVGLFILFFAKAGKTARYWILGILGVVVLLVSNFVLVPHEESAPSTFGAPAGSEYDGSADVPAVWMDGLEDQFTADVYPSMRSAARALGRQLAESLPTVVGSEQVAAAVVVRKGKYRDEITGRSLDALASVLRSKGEIKKVLFDSDSDVTSSGGSGGTDKQFLTIEVSLPECSFVDKNGTRIRGSGTLGVSATGPAGQFAKTIGYMGKPWVDNFAEYVNLHRKGDWIIVARSQTSCTSEAQAREQAMRNACEQITAHLPENLRRRSPADTLVSSAGIRNRGYIVDRFAQSLRGSSGPIWREAMLIVISPRQMADLARGAEAKVSQWRRSWGNSIFSLLGMLVLICLVYLFLNTATKGYYTLTLRITAAAVVLGLAAIFVALKTFHYW